MSGYLGGDHCAINAQAIIDDNIALVRSFLPVGESRQYCIECGDSIPSARREAMPGVTRCILCQENQDRCRPRLRSVIKML